MTLLQFSFSNFRVLIIVMSIGMIAGCATDTGIPKPPIAQDPFAGLPISKPGEVTPLEDVSIGKHLKGLKVGLLLTGNTKTTSQYANTYLAAVTGGRGNPSNSANVVVTPVLEAIAEGLEQVTPLNNWEDAKATNVDLVALADLSCTLPETQFDNASYSANVYMLTPDGQLVGVIRAMHRGTSFDLQQMMLAQTTGRAIDQAQGGLAKTLSINEQQFVDNELMKSGSGATILQVVRKVRQQLEQRLRDFLEEVEESRAFVNRGKQRHIQTP